MLFNKLRNQKKNAKTGSLWDNFETCTWNQQRHVPAVNQLPAPPPQQHIRTPTDLRPDVNPDPDRIHFHQGLNPDPDPRRGLDPAAVCLAADLASSVLGLVPPPPTLLPPPLPPFHAAGDAPAAAGPGTEPMTSGSAGRNAADGVHAAITAVVRQLEDLVASSLRLGMLVAAAPGGMALRLVAPGTPIIAPYGAVQEGQLAPPQVAAPVVPAAPTAPQLVLAVEWLSLELEDDDRLCSRGSDGGTMGTSGGGSSGGSRSNIRSGVVLWVVSPGLVCRQGRGGEASLYADSTGDGSGNSTLPVASTADGVRERVLIPVHVVGWSA
ncbi:hypothetical protein VOLCADRAFT_93396 [Volvox carteri f. nagariensis]|uniref:Uncharacterized protein n=1 Tax=Volvox carteri f. nagariensis TaxID=3068 RepID=D8U207_VOLCA|nr:uncharacterized protein VOLCADRAFT_93396 [Volvox carteri f. nagariensis]EFJ46279.1 hypothetical protein VOLCADRAFT_93396 [Volvox carteri f. nagariensis]|eukprot:XP_002952726.1 hypothetical protein VOLCADRAFT_93396 [Volvox carteri f. nagariensis]